MSRSALLLFWSLAGLVFGQSGAERAKAVFAELDVNRDKVVRLGEFVKACQSLSFKNLDANSDGRIARSEWIVVENRPSAEVQFGVLDANGDQALTPKEFGASPASRQRWQAVFHTLDQDGDAALRPSEFPRSGS